MKRASGISTNREKLLKGTKKKDILFLP